MWSPKVTCLVSSYLGPIVVDSSVVEKLGEDDVCTVVEEQLSISRERSHLTGKEAPQVIQFSTLFGYYELGLELHLLSDGSFELHETSFVWHGTTDEDSSEPDEASSGNSSEDDGLALTIEEGSFSATCYPSDLIRLGIDREQLRKAFQDALARGRRSTKRNALLGCLDLFSRVVWVVFEYRERGDYVVDALLVDEEPPGDSLR